MRSPMGFLGRDNRIYIIPSGRGMVFLALIVVLVLVGATYNSNLIFMMAFFLFSLFIVSMLQTHYNIKGVRLNFLSSAEGFAGEGIPLLLELEQRRSRHKFALCLRAKSKDFVMQGRSMAELSSDERRKPVRLVVIASRRGVHPIPKLILETYYPLGLFCAWKVFRPQGEVTVYPSPLGSQTLHLESSDTGENELGLRNSPEGDFGELKPYQPGESYHQVAWKHFARTGNLYSKVHWGQEQKHFHIPWSPQAQPLEKYLEQMSAWIQIAVNEDGTFAMDLPLLKIPAGQGQDHARVCWRALAALKEAA